MLDATKDFGAGAADAAQSERHTEGAVVALHGHAVPAAEDHHRLGDRGDLGLGEREVTGHGEIIGTVADGDGGGDVVVHYEDHNDRCPP